MGWPLGGFHETCWAFDGLEAVGSLHGVPHLGGSCGISERLAGMKFA